jgi:hypothetical protein
MTFPMHHMHPNGHAAAKFSARPRVSVIGDFSHPAARRLAREVCFVVGVLLLWAMLSPLLLSKLEKAGDPGTCVSFGRAGTHCAETPGGGGQDPSASGQDCRSLGRGGWGCQPKTPSN